MSTETESFLAKARERFKLAQEAEARIREEALADLEFRAGRQWPDDVRSQRTLDKRPCLTINRLPSIIKQVTNEQRQNRPAIKVSPVDDHADPETAEVIQGIVRHIEVNSNADQAYDKAHEDAVTMGFGYFRVVTEYLDPRSFDQEIVIKRIRNPFTVYFDPACQEPDYSDARFAFIVEEVSKDEYKELYPRSEMAGLTDFASVGDRAAGWLTGSSVRVAEYFYVEKQPRTLAVLADGSVVFLEEVPEGAQVVAKRETQVPTVHWCKINGIEKLEETAWPGQWIPIVPVLGDELDINGERQLIGMVRDAKDPQRMYNYWATAETEMIALAPRAPFIGAEGQFEGHEVAWKQANVRNFAYVEYKPTSVAGHPIPPPQRQVFEPPIQAISMARMQSAEDLKATTGIYDASLGARSNETSGVAIQARQREGDVANFHFTDNLSRAIRHCGRILIDLIPKVYDTPRVVRIIGADEQQKTVQVNQPFMEGGVNKLYDLSVGRYDVTVSAGPSFMTKRQESVASMMELTKTYPQLAQIAGDLLVKNMDWPGADQIAERLKKLLPPELQDDEEKPIPPCVQAQMNALMEQHKQLTAALDQATEALNTKKLELESRERIEALKVQADLVKTEAQLASKEGIELLRAEIAAISRRLDVLNVDEPVTEGV